MKKILRNYATYIKKLIYWVNSSKWIEFLPSKFLLLFKSFCDQLHELMLDFEYNKKLKLEIKMVPTNREIKIDIDSNIIDDINKNYIQATNDINNNRFFVAIHLITSDILEKIIINKMNNDEVKTKKDIIKLLNLFFSDGIFVNEINLWIKNLSIVRNAEKSKTDNKQNKDIKNNPFIKKLNNMNNESKKIFCFFILDFSKSLFNLLISIDSNISIKKINQSKARSAISSNANITLKSKNI